LEGKGECMTRSNLAIDCAVLFGVECRESEW